MTIGEIADRYSICKLKSERTNIDCSQEMENLKAALDGYEAVDIYLEELYEINGNIWSLEGDIRSGREGMLGLKEVGRRALQIRNFNGMRISVKNKINEFYNEGFTEIKSDHASE